MWMLIILLKLQKSTSKQADFLKLVNVSLTRVLNNYEEYLDFFQKYCEILFDDKKAVILINSNPKFESQLENNLPHNEIKQCYIYLLIHPEKFKEIGFNLTKVKKVDNDNKNEENNQSDENEVDELIEKYRNGYKLNILKNAKNIPDEDSDEINDQNEVDLIAKNRKSKAPSSSNNYQKDKKDKNSEKPKNANLKNIKYKSSEKGKIVENLKKNKKKIYEKEDKNIKYKGRMKRNSRDKSNKKSFSKESEKSSETEEEENPISKYPLKYPAKREQKKSFVIKGGNQNIALSDKDDKNTETSIKKYKPHQKIKSKEFESLPKREKGRQSKEENKKEKNNKKERKITEEKKKNSKDKKDKKTEPKKNNKLKKIDIEEESEDEFEEIKNQKGKKINDVKKVNIKGKKYEDEDNEDNEITDSGYSENSNTEVEVFNQHLQQFEKDCEVNSDAEVMAALQGNDALFNDVIAGKKSPSEGISNSVFSSKDHNDMLDLDIDELDL